jgi:hypothetical protein
VELVNLLMWAEYAGPEWRQFREALARYGVAVLHKWILSGRTFAECATKGFGAVSRRRGDDRDEALGIAGETVARALNFFRERVLIRGVWDPAKGASVQTYFVGACALHFPNVYERPQGVERMPLSLARDDDDSSLLLVEDSRATRPDHRAEAIAAFEALPDGDTRTMVIRRAEGYADEEIGLALRTTRKAIETRFYRLHRRMR